MDKFILRGCEVKQLQPINPPYMPDGSVAYIDVEQTPGLPHNRNSHGWPANVIQQYADAENTHLQELYMQRLIEQANKAPAAIDAELTDAQKCALTMRRTAQTCGEYLSEAIRVSELRESFKSSFSVDETKTKENETKMKENET